MSPQTKMDGEVTLQEIFADPIVQLLMARDGITARDCEAVLTASIERSPGKGMVGPLETTLRWAGRANH